MWTWPGRLFLLSLGLFLGGMALGYATDDPDGETGLAAVGQAIAIVASLSSFLVAGLAVLTAIGALFNRPGEPRHWAWRGGLSTLAYLGWLGVCFFIWIAAHTGGGGLDGPCEPGAWGSEVGGSAGTCRTEVADWPPLSTRAVVEGSEGHHEALFPSTVGLIVIIVLALLPLALWPLARWLTMADRSGRPPVERLAWLLGTALAVSLAYSAVVNEESSRPLTEAEAAELDAKEAAAQAAAAAAPPEPPPIVATHVHSEDVARAVADEREPSAARLTACSTGTESGIGLWVCNAGIQLAGRITVRADGSYDGVIVDHSGIERPFRGCCVPVAPAGA